MLHKIGQALSGILLTVLIIACLLLVAPRIFGIQLFSVLSGSMEPSFHVNDLVYAFPAKYEQIAVGDPITFKLNENTIVTHRVIKKDDGKRCLYTKGDANETADGTPAAYDDVIGVVRFYIPAIGGVLQSISSGSGRIVALTSAAVVILLTLLLTINGQPDGEDEEEPRRAGKHKQADADAPRRRTPRSLDAEWGLESDGYAPPERQKRRQPRVIASADDAWEREAARRRAWDERQRAQSAPAQRRRSFYAEEDDWGASSEESSRYEGREEAPPRQPVRRVQRPSNRYEEPRNRGSADERIPPRTRTAGMRAEASAAESKRREMDVRQQMEQPKSTRRRAKAQLPPAWR